MNTQYRRFTQTVRDHYERHGRQSLPWRLSYDPYRVLVSEIMLQQTQVDRVIPKYTSFLKRFPDVQTLADASLGDVLREWQGLGYNRRAKMLHSAAKEIVSGHGGVFPDTYAGLTKLPGIGPYTAGAVLAFAYNVPVPLIETNVRTVYIHHFFQDNTDVDDRDILKLVEKTLDTENPRMWYAALMDYGAHLKKTVGNPNSRSKHYTKQGTFKNSDRHIRGAILRLLSAKSRSRKSFHTELPFPPDRIDAQLERLKEEGMIAQERNSYRLP